jgi:FkbM family methyltransferase
MQGTVRDPHERQAQRKVWEDAVIPALMADEVGPILPLLKRRSGLIAVDVGANKGYWAKALLRLCGDAVERIHMIDPSPENYQELIGRTDNMMFVSADFPKLAAYECAMGASAGEATLYADDEGSVLGSLYPHLLNGYSDPGMAAIELSRTRQVAVDRLDDFLARHGLAHVDVLKIDVEGHEMDVLLGGITALSAGTIDLVTLEIGPHQVESRHFFRDFYTLFEALGFRLYRVAERLLHPIDRYEYQYENFSDNFIYVAEQVGAPAPDWAARAAGTGPDTDRVKLAAALAALRGENEWLRGERAALLNSRSWRMTAPLRRVVRLLRRLG